MKIYVINETLVKNGTTYIDTPEVFTNKREAEKEFRRRIHMGTINHPSYTRVKESDEFGIKTRRIYKGGKRHTDYHEVTLASTVLPEAERVKVKPGFDFLATIDCRNQYDEGFGYFSHYATVLTTRVHMVFTKEYRHETKLEKAMIRENKIPAKNLHDAFGCVILKDGYEFLISCYYDCEYHVHPYALDIKANRLVDVTTICPKLKRTQFWTETPEGYTFKE